MSFISELSKRIGRDRKETESLVDALGKVILQYCGELDSVAVPSFGNFEPVKHEEQIVIDHSTGSRMLLPPELELTFKPAGKLRKITQKRDHEQDYNAD